MCRVISVDEVRRSLGNYAVCRRRFRLVMMWSVDDRLVLPGVCLIPLSCLFSLLLFYSDGPFNVRLYTALEFL